MEEMNARVMENEVMDETVEVDEAVDSGNAGALVAGIVGGFLAYAVIGGAKKLWGFAVYTAILGILVIVDQFVTHFFF